jgi:hypothetical protein
VKQAALTLWFTLATLLGPVACCCSLAAAAPVAPATRPPAESPAKPQHARSCCKQHAAETTARATPHPSQPTKPARCPCESGQRLTSLPPKPSLAAPTEQPPSFDPLSPADRHGALPHVARAAAAAAVQPVFHLAGRDLLAVYSVLLC